MAVGHLEIGNLDRSLVVEWVIDGLFSRRMLDCLAFKLLSKLHLVAYAFEIALDSRSRRFV